jgi:O-antigen/teichoic acid export membrane protein
VVIAAFKSRLTLPHGLPRDVLIYGVGGSAAQVLNLVFLPIFTRIFTPAEFGALDFLLTLNSIGSLIALAGLNSAVFFHFRRIQDRAERRSMIASALIIATTLGALIAVLGATLAGPIAAAVGLAPNQAPAVALTFVWVPVNVVGTLALDLLRLQFRPVAYSVLGIGRALFAGAIGAFLAGVVGLGISGLLLAYIVFGIAGIALTLWLGRDAWSLTFSGAEARRLVRFGLPLLPTGLAYWVIVYSDRFFLIQLLGVSSAGIYAVANRAALGVQLVLYAFEAAWWPYAYARARAPGHRQEFAQIFTVVTVSTLCIAVLLGVFAREILLVVTTPEFVPAYPYVGVLALSLVVHGGYTIISVGVQLGERTADMAWTSGMAAVANVALNVLLIPLLGIAGAAFATLAAYTVSTVLLYGVAQRRYPTPYRLAVVGGAALLGVALLIAALLLDALAVGTAWSLAITLAKSGLSCVALLFAAVLVRSQVPSLLPRGEGTKR